jgi:hypothetical protein
MNCMNSALMVSGVSLALCCIGCQRQGSESRPRDNKGVVSLSYNRQSEGFAEFELANHSGDDVVVRGVRETGSPAIIIDAWRSIECQSKDPPTTWIKPMGGTIYDYNSPIEEVRVRPGRTQMLQAHVEDPFPSFADRNRCRLTLKLDGGLRFVSGLFPVVSDQRIDRGAK